MRGFMKDLAKLLSNTVCQICYEKTEVLDAAGTWCKRCHRTFTDGLIHPQRRVNLVDLIKRYRRPVKEEEPKKKK